MHEQYSDKEHIIPANAVVNDDASNSDEEYKYEKKLIFIHFLSNLFKFLSIVHSDRSFVEFF